MKKPTRDRVILEVGDRKLVQRVRDKAHKNGNTLKYAIESALKDYLKKKLDLQ